MLYLRTALSNWHGTYTVANEPIHIQSFSFSRRAGEARIVEQWGRVIGSSRVLYDNRGSICYLQHRFDYLASYHDETTTFSFWKMSSLDWSFLQVTNNQTKNNGGEGGGAPSSPRAKGTAAVALHVKFSKCRSAPIMQRFPLSSLICIQICRAEERRPSKFVL